MLEANAAQSRPANADAEPIRLEQGTGIGTYPDRRFAVAGFRLVKWQSRVSWKADLMLPGARAMSDACNPIFEGVYRAMHLVARACKRGSREPCFGDCERLDTPRAIGDLPLQQLSDTAASIARSHRWFPIGSRSEPNQTEAVFG